MPLRTGAFFLTLIFLACGYQIVGFSKSRTNKESQTTYYIEPIRNNTSDQTITTEMSQYVVQFFSDYGSLLPKDTAQHILTIALENYSITAATKTSSRDAVTLNLYVTYSFKVSDAAGKNLYTKTIQRVQSFSASDSVADYDQNLKETFENITDDILSDFRNDFEISL